MLFNFRVFLWSIIAELEYILYPWKTKSPPEWVRPEYKIPEDYEKNFNDDWLKSHDEKINRLQQEMLFVQKQIHKLNVHLKTHG